MSDMSLRGKGNRLMGPIDVVPVDDDLLKPLKTSIDRRYTSSNESAETAHTTFVQKLRGTAERTLRPLVLLDAQHYAQFSSFFSLAPEIVQIKWEIPDTDGRLTGYMKLSPDRSFVLRMVERFMNDKNFLPSKLYYWLSAGEYGHPSVSAPNAAVTPREHWWDRLAFTRSSGWLAVDGEVFNPTLLKSEQRILVSYTSYGRLMKEMSK